MGKSRRKWRRAPARDWMAGLHLPEAGLLDGPLTKTGFDELTSDVLAVNLDELASFGSLESRIYAVDARWRLVVLCDGSTREQTHWKVIDGNTYVSVRGSLADNKSVIGSVFKRLDIAGYVFMGEAWLGGGVPAGMSSAVTRTQSFGRAEAVLMEAHCPMVSHSRLVLAPMVRLGDSVTASVLHDAQDVHEGHPSPLMLADCLPHWNRRLGVTESPQGVYEGDTHG